jgi:hypothetical protein
MITSPKTKTPAQNPNPAALCYFVYPFTMIDINVPSRKPPKLPTAKSIPTAEPYPTGKTS